MAEQGGRGLGQGWSWGWWQEDGGITVVITMRCHSSVTPMVPPCTPSPALGVGDWDGMSLVAHWGPFCRVLMLCCRSTCPAVCEGNFTCKENEVCVRPGECRCRHGYFGANCDTKCPRQFWGPDCKEMCSCHPNGQCEDVTGQCTCNPNRWGPKCENICLCKHGKCDQKTGKCTCEPNWWGPQCSSSCYCSHNSQCDQQTGNCLCQPGWWGRGCNNQCSCNNSPCEQFTGRCQCRERTFGPRCDRYCQCYKGKCNQVDGTCTCEPGYRGKYCREPCPAGFYGQGCRRRCGQCKSLQPCTVADGRCLTCEAGWNGTKCDQPCSAGFYGEGCEKLCPPCKDGHTCNHINGKCSHCNPGWIGDRCETKCRNGTYGENCAFVCSDCVSGECHFETGRCLCRAGSHGTYCNLTCPPGHYGANCAQACSCHDGACDPLTGACHMEANQRMGVIGAGALLALLLILLLSLLCCCCVCRKKDEGHGANQDPVAAKKPPRRLCGRFSRISMKLPRIPLRRQKMPKVVVAHHDLENTLNCSFIEPPSVVEQPSPSWSSRGSFSSFDTTDEGPVYCVPHEESVGDGLCQGLPCRQQRNTPAQVLGQRALILRVRLGQRRALCQGRPPLQAVQGGGGDSSVPRENQAPSSRPVHQAQGILDPQPLQLQPVQLAAQPLPGASGRPAQQPRARPRFGQEEEEPQRDVGWCARQSRGEGQWWHTWQGETAEAPQGTRCPRGQSQPCHRAPVAFETQAEEQGQLGADGEYQRGGAERLQKDGRLPCRAAGRGGPTQPRCWQAALRGSPSPPGLRGGHAAGSPAEGKDSEPQQGGGQLQAQRGGGPEGEAHPTSESQALGSHRQPEGQQAPAAHLSQPAETDPRHGRAGGWGRAQAGGETNRSQRPGPGSSGRADGQEDAH
uniref:EGF-like domain-containing protein n=1 Tax=Meleagris gallopavo TaxID=9103 RepID=G1NB65_MELGA